MLGDGSCILRKKVGKVILKGLFYNYKEALLLKTFNK